MLMLINVLPSWQILLAVYALCYILQNKIDILHQWYPTAKMTECSFCTGFVSGLCLYLFLAASWDPVMAILWALMSGASCAILDPVVRCFENNSSSWPGGLP